MRRRQLLSAVAGGTAAAFGGCIGGGGDSTGDAGNRNLGLPDPASDRPSGVYRPTVTSEMRVVGTTTAGDYRFHLLYSHPSRFWDLNGRQRYLRDVKSDHTMHLMVMVSDAETGRILPEVSVTAEVLNDGELITQKIVYNMLSQRMSFHYGDNVTLDGAGTYTVNISLSAIPLRRTGRFGDRFETPTTATFEMEYRPSDREELALERYGDSGTSGAVELSGMDALPELASPTPESLPGSFVGRATTDDAVLVGRQLRADAANRFGDGAYFAVLGRTPYNGLTLPLMGLRARVQRDGTTVTEEILSRTVDPELGYHYGASFATEPGDVVTLDPLSAPQLARHEGYETAFVEMEPVELSA